MFLKTLGETCMITGWRVHAWVLMSNHYHLFIETPEANLVAGMQWLQNGPLYYQKAKMDRFCQELMPDPL